MSRHVPSVYSPRPWVGATIETTGIQQHHLQRVLRIPVGSSISYTDGEGIRGTGMLKEPGIERGSEEEMAPPPLVHLAVAPPQSVDRSRFIVEKLQELGVRRLSWLTTIYGQAKAPREDKTRVWAISALEQSRGVWLMEIDGPIGIADIAAPLLTDPNGTSTIDGMRTVCIGPEGGWAPDEIPNDVPVAALGATILRTETAAVVAATHAIVAALSDGD